MSILRDGQRKSHAEGDLAPKTVRFQLQFDLKTLFLDYVSTKNIVGYEDFIRNIRDTGQQIENDDLIQLLKEARGCIYMLDKNLQLFIQVILLLKWSNRGLDVVQEYHNFLIDLCTAHSYYTKQVIEHLVKHFRAENSIFNEDGSLMEEEHESLVNVHNVLRSILKVVPMSQPLLISSIKSCWPYLSKPPHEHQSFIYNLLSIIEYDPDMQRELFNFIINKLVSFDVRIPQQNVCSSEQTALCDSVFKMEVDGATETDKTVEYHTSLDLCMRVLLNYLKRECHQENSELLWHRAKSLYEDLLKIFETVILLTHQARHVQFILFYLLSFKAILTSSFLSSLWKKVLNPSVPPLIRQNALYFTASLLTRAVFIPKSTVQSSLVEISGWIHSYLNNCEKNCAANCDTRIHSVFYSACQSLFYIIAFRHKDLTTERNDLLLLQSLNLSKIVTCKLNPLKVCQEPVIHQFAAVARAYQLAYCYTIMEQNSRSRLPQIDRGSFLGVPQASLDCFFPFDPPNLPKSFLYISPFYRHFTEDFQTSRTPEPTKEDESDDFLDPAPSTSNRPHLFQYSTSPGFCSSLSP